MVSIARRGGAVIYVASDGMNTKVGRTSNPDRRLKQLEESRGRSVRMCFTTEKRVDVVLVEARAHQLLIDKTLGSEWFDVSPDDAWSAVMRAIDDVERGWRCPKSWWRKGKLDRDNLSYSD
jgi:hypothetical protein